MDQSPTVAGKWWAREGVVEGGLSTLVWHRYNVFSHYTSKSLVVIPKNYLSLKSVERNILKICKSMCIYTNNSIINLREKELFLEEKREMKCGLLHSF